MAILYAYFDEGGKHQDHPVTSLCGVCAPQSKLREFDADWNGLLRHYRLPFLHTAKALRVSQKLSPKIPKQTFDARIECLKPFADCINKHLELALLQAWEVKGFNEMSPEAKSKLGNTKDPYYTAFARALIEIVDHVHGDDRVSIICDDDPVTAWNCYEHYRGVREAHDAVKKKTVSLSFADDKYFPALQAADMVAVLTRLEFRSQLCDKQYQFENLFDYMTTGPTVRLMNWMKMFADRETLKKVSKLLDGNK